MTWAILVLLGGCGIVCLMLVPVDLSVSVEREAGVKAQVGFRWLFIRLTKDLSLGHKRSARTKKPRKKARHRRGSSGFRTGASILRVQGLGSSLRRLLVGLVRSIRLGRLHGIVRVGGSDPADTGRLCAVLLPSAFLLNRWPRLHLEVLPNFRESELTFQLDGTIRVYPARVVKTLIMTVFSRTSFRLLVAVFRNSLWKK